MKLFRFAPLLLATALQLLPLGRVLVTSQLAAPSGFAVVFRWAVGAVALLGSYHAVSGASTLIKSPITAKGTNGVAFQYSIKAGPDTPNQYDAVPLPTGLAVSHTSGKITGTPTETGVFIVLLTASDNGRPDRTVTTNLTLTIIDKPAGGTLPSITTQPASQTVTAGANVTFTVVASSAAPLTYQWKKGTSALAGQTAASLTLNSVSAADAATYTVDVSNSAGTVTSAPASLTVNPVVVLPTITTQPASQTVTAGANVTFTVVASSAAPLTYQWKKGTSALAGQTAASLTLNSVSAADAATYTVDVSNSAGTVTSAPASLTVNPVVVLPTITTQPASQTVTAGANVTFTVVASSTAPLTYQWKKGTSALAGQTAASLTLNSVSAADAATYTVDVSNSAGTVTSAPASLTVNPVVVLPTITTQPASQTVTAGANVTFTVVASSTAPVTYQWKKGTSALAGQTAASLTLNSVSAADAATYTVDVSNSAGTVTSAPASLTVNPVVVLPTITTQPASQTVTAGANVTFTVVASSAAPLTYQWKKGTTALAGQTAASLTLNSVSAADAATYTVDVSNSAGTVTSAPASLTVNPVVVLPTITTQPASQTVTAGANVTFTVVASSTAPLTYQWKKGTTALAGQTAASLTLNSVSAADAATYTVDVSNSAGTVTSTPAVLAVQVPPTITTQPQAQAVQAGGTATFTVAAAGTGPLSYQWKFNNEVLANATAPSLTLTNIPATSAGDYLVVVSNAAGTINSLPAHLTVQVASTSTLLLATPGLVNGAFALHVTGPAGTNFVIWSTSDLVQWTPISTNAAVDGTLDVTDPALVSQRFFRATLAP